MFRNGDKCQAFSWKGNKWELVGDVTGAVNTKKYEGDWFFPAGEYDFIFLIEVDDSGVKKKLPFNKGDNPLVCAEKFLAREQLSVNYKE